MSGGRTVTDVARDHPEGTRELLEDAERLGLDGLADQLRDAIQKAEAEP